MGVAHLKLEAELPQLRLSFARPAYLGESGVALEELVFDYKSIPPVVVNLKEAVRTAGTAKICTAISIIDVTPEIEAELCNSLEGDRVKIPTLHPDTVQTLDSHFQRIRAVARSIIVMLNWTHGLDGPPDPYGLAYSWYSSNGNEWFQYSLARTLSLSFAQATHSIYSRNVQIDEIVRKVEAGAEEPLARQLFREAWGQIGTNPRSALVIGVAAVEVGLRGLVIVLVPGTDLRRRPISRILREILPTLPIRARLIDGGPITPPPELIKQIEDAIKHRNKVVHAGKPAPAREELAVMLRAISDFLWMCDIYLGELWAIKHISREILKHWQLKSAT
jgi:hypothetical protein